ncbi:MAG: endolytic transglycosylase MltG [Bacteroidia bacterium]
MAAKAKRKLITAFVLSVIALLIGLSAYFALLKPNIYLDGKKYKFIYISNRLSYDEMVNMLEEENILENKKTFEWLAKAYNLQENFKPGKYRVIAGMTNRQLINLIKSGKQEPVKITFNSADRTPEDIITKISEKLDISETELEAFFENETEVRKKYNFNKETIRCLFLPATYELNWNTSLPDLIKEVEDTYNKFWTTARKQKAKQIKLTQAEVSILASIVQCESAIGDEQEKIAGVYINRMQKNMPLQADPTLLYAIGDFKRQRVLNEDKDINSPYNTYRTRGLPPGPICLPYTQAMDAVLNYKRHNFVYFCAKPSLNGFSDYSETYEQHRRFAEAYQREMDKRGINK